MGGANDNPKARLRRELTARRRAVTPGDLARASAAVCERVLGTAAFRAARHLVLYAPRPEEVDPFPLEIAARQAGAITYYPRADDPGLRFHRATKLDLVPGRHGILEPLGAAPHLEVDETDVVILVPGLSFDQHGGRLGSGLGYYDRTLIAFPRARRIGLTLEALLVDRLPIDPWDVPVHLITTETRLLDVDVDVAARPGDPAWSC